MVLNRFDVDAGAELALDFDGGAPDAAPGVVPTLPPADDAEDECFAAFDGERGDEVVEGLILAVGVQERAGGGDTKEDL